MSELVHIEVVESIAYVEIDNPPLNIVDDATLSAFIEAIDSLENTSSIRALVLSGAGKSFSAGASIEEHLPAAAPEMISKMATTLERLHTTPLVTVAMAQGLCLGGGAEIALGCDFVIGADNLRIGIPEITVGSYPPFAMLQLPSLIGIQAAKEMILSGRLMEADEAQSSGLIAIIVPQDELRSTAESLLAPILKNSPSIVSLALLHMRELNRLLVDPGYSKMGQLFLADLLDHPDYLEGLTAFLEKRSADWQPTRILNSGGNLDAI